VAAPARPVTIYRGSEKGEAGATVAQVGGSSDAAPPIPSVPAR
jgi:pilus assembly protein CpaB